MKKQILKLQSEFDAAMIELYRRALVEATYHSSHFLRMLSEHRGLKTAQTLLRPQQESEGFTALWERKRLDLTMEVMIHDNPKWHPLFREQELATCAARLEQHGYKRCRVRLVCYTPDWTAADDFHARRICPGGQGW